MSQAQFVRSAQGALVLSGVLDYSTGPGLREQGRRLIGESAEQTLLLDCAGVEKSSSVGLALLLAFMRDAEAQGKQLQVQGLPREMQQIAEVSGLLEWLPLQG